MPQLSLQVLRDPADFLFLVPVPMFFPGLSHHIGRVGCSCRHEAAPRPVAHGSPDTFHQGTNVLLEKETQPPVTEEKILNHCSLSVKPDTGKLRPCSRAAGRSRQAAKACQQLQVCQAVPGPQRLPLM